MDRKNKNSKAGSPKFILFCCFAFATAGASAAGVELDGATNTGLDTAPNGVPIVNIARPNSSGLSHNTYRRFDVDRPGLILNNASQTTVNTRLGGHILGNTRLNVPARVILNEVTSTNRSRLDGYTEVAGQGADVVIANPNGISVNGAGFINAPRVTLTTGRPIIDVFGNLGGFDVGGGDIAIEGDGLNTELQDATSIYTHFMKLNAKLHARELDVVLGQNRVDYPGRKIARVGSSGLDRVVLDSSALGGMYANKIVLIGTDQGLGMNLPPEVIASSGEIEITNTGRLVLHKMDAGGDIRLRTDDAIESNDTVYSAGNVEMQAAGEIRLESGMIGADGRLSIEADRVENQAILLAGIGRDGFFNAVGELSIRTRDLLNRNEIIATDGLEVIAESVANQGIFNAFDGLHIEADVLRNEATIFSGFDAGLLVHSHLTNAPGASIFAVNDLRFAAGEQGERTDLIVNDLGLIQTLQGDIGIHARRFDNLGGGDLQYQLAYYDLGNGREVSDPGAAMTIDLEYSTGYTKHRSTARRRWVNEVLRRLSIQAPLLYSDVAGDIRSRQYARFLAIESRLLNQSTTNPAYLDSGNDLNLDVDEFLNYNSITAAARDINFSISGDYLNEVLSVTEQVTDYQYYVRAEHRDNWKDEDKYTSIGHAGYIPVARAKTVSTSTVTQAGRDINGDIGGQAVNSGVLLGQYQSHAGVDPNDYSGANIDLPAGDFGLFVKSKMPDSQYLVETNPRFTGFGNFVSSSYLLDRLDFSGNAELKRLGDALYESKLIRDSVFAQTGRRFLDPGILSDNQQFQYLMDNALLAQAELELAPGVALRDDQINRLTRDIVWLVQVEIDGQHVLAPTVYLANGPRSKVHGGRIQAGGDVRMVLASLENDGLIGAGSDLDLQASGEIRNRGMLKAAEKLDLQAVEGIENVSGRISGRDVNIRSARGNIVNRRESAEYAWSNREIDYSVTQLGDAGLIEAQENLVLEAGGDIEIEGSDIDGGRVGLKAETVDIATATVNENYFAGDSDNHVHEVSTRHFASNINGDDIVILSRGSTRVDGSRLNSRESLRMTAADIDINAVNDSDYYARYVKEDKTLGESVRSNKSFRGKNVASELGGATVVLVTEHGDIEISGSSLAASNSLVLDSRGDIRISAGHDDSLDESYSHESSWFSGDSLYEETENLDGRMKRSAVKSRIEAASLSVSAQRDVEFSGVDIALDESMTAVAENVSIRNTSDEERTYTKHTEITVGLDDLSSDPEAIDELVTQEDGKLKIQLGSAEYENAESTTHRNTVVASQIEAAAIEFNAGRNETGDISIEGSDLKARESIVLNASGDVELLDARHEFVREDLKQQGSAVVNWTFQNEYEQVARAIKAVRDAERDLRHAEDDYDEYRQEVKAQRVELDRLKRQYASGTGFVEKTDINEFKRYLARLEDDEEFYQANVALAATTLASKTTALIQQAGKAASSSATYGFNMGIELNIDALENLFDEYYRESRASNLSANLLSINAGDDAWLRGSNLLAGDGIDISAGNIDIEAGRNIHTSREREQRLNLTYGWDLMGGASSADPQDLGGGISAEGSQRDGESRTHTKAQLLAGDIRLTAAGDASIRGADIAARDRLEITAGNLDVSSVQDIGWSDRHSRGLSYSGAGAGANAAEGYSENLRTQVTRLTGREVDISVADHTDLQGAIIASVDEAGADNGQLKLATETLSAGSMNNTVESNNRALGFFGGETSTLDFSDDSANSKTRSLATLGRGDIQIGDTERSDTRFLNTDVTDTEAVIYDIESHQGLSGELDVRLLSAKGRTDIAQDLESVRTAAAEISRHVKTWVHNVPEEIRNQVGAGLETYYDNLIQNGYEPDQINSLIQNPYMVEFLKYAIDLEQDFIAGNYRLGWEDASPDSSPLASDKNDIDKNQIVVVIAGGTNAADRPLKYRLNQTLQNGHELLKQVPGEKIELALRLVSAVTGGPAKVVLGEVVNQFVAQTLGEDLAQVQRFVTEQAAEYLNDKPDGYYQTSSEERRQLGVSAEFIERTQKYSEAELGGAELGIVVLGTLTGSEILTSKKKSETVTSISYEGNRSNTLKKTNENGKHANHLDVSYRSADEVNLEFLKKGHKRPYKKGTRVTEFTTKVEESFVRVHTADNPNRSWMIRKEAIEGLTATQIQQKYSLPTKPAYISEIHVPAGTRVRRGRVESNFKLHGGGGQGAIQYQWIEGIVPRSAIKNTVPLR